MRTRLLGYQITFSRQVPDDDGGMFEPGDRLTADISTPKGVTVSRVGPDGLLRTYRILPHVWEWARASGAITITNTN